MPSLYFELHLFCDLATFVEVLGLFLQWLDGAHEYHNWTEVLGPNLQPSWIRIEVIPLRAGTETVFVCIGEGMGQVLTIDEDATHKRRVDCVPVQILREMSPLSHCS